MTPANHRPDLSQGRFRRIDAIVWRRRSDKWDAYLILKLGPYYEVLVEDDGNWTAVEDLFLSEGEAREYIVQRNVGGDRNAPYSPNNPSTDPPTEVKP